jgi:hypothetical protein
MVSYAHADLRSTLSEARLEISWKGPMRLADKRFRGPDREPWDPQRALHLGLRAETFAASHTRRLLAGIPFHLRHRDGQVHVLGARVDVRGDALPATPRIYLAHDTNERLAPFPIGLRAKVHDPDT